MLDAAENQLTELNHLIAQAEERRIEQILHIAALSANDESVTAAEERLRRIGELLAKMKAVRNMQPGPRA